MRVQQRQEQVAAAQRIQASAKRAREARATARVSAGEAGVAGLSVDALINDLTRQEAENRFATNSTNTDERCEPRDAAKRCWAWVH